MALGKLGGSKGGTARAARLTPEQRKEIAQKAAGALAQPRFAVFCAVSERARYSAGYSLACMILGVTAALLPHRYAWFARERAKGGTMIPETTIKAILFKEEDWYVAQCLDYDIATQARSIQDLYYELEHVLVGHVVVAQHEECVPFEGLPRAPKRYWDMYRHAKLRLEPVTPTEGPSVELRCSAA